MMTCNCDHDLLQGYLDGVLSPGDELKALRHLTLCRECRQALRTWKLIYWELDHLPKVEIPPKLTHVSDRVMTLVEARLEKEARRQQSPGEEGRGWLDLAAAAVTLTFRPLQRVPDLGGGIKLARATLARSPAALAWLARSGLRLLRRRSVGSSDKVKARGAWGQLLSRLIR